MENNNETVYYRAATSKNAYVLVFERNSDIRIIALKGTAQLGRKTSSSNKEIELLSPIASRDHGVFFQDEEGDYYYRDNNSLNGTFINGSMIEKYNEKSSKAVKLADGDVLRIDRKELDNPHKDVVLMIFSYSAKKEDEWNRLLLDDSKELTIGRDRNCNVVLNDFMASRKHASLIHKPDGWYIADNNSTNGVAVNNSQIDEVKKLHTMDIIKIANCNIIYTGDSIYFTGEENRSENPVVMNVNINEVNVNNGMFKKKTLLKDINLDINAGDFVLILGGAGAGKSTFIKTLMGDMKSDGSIILEGIDVIKNPKIVRHKIGFVPQFSTTRQNDTVYHTIMDAAINRLAGGYSRDEIEKRVEQILDKLMLTDLQDSMIRNLSGGQKKRVEVALQSITDQRVFILDEPDSGMDAASRTDLMRNLKACTEGGNAVMVISHSPDEPAELFTKVIVLAKSEEDKIGHLAFYGNVQEAYRFFGVNKLTDIIVEINYEGGHGRATEFVNKFARMKK